MYNDELMHFGIKGQKWGIRRYQNKNGSLTPAGIKRYAKEGYAEDYYNKNKTAVGKAYDKLTGANKISADIKYKTSSASQNKKRAEDYVKEKETRKANEKKMKQELRKNDLDHPAASSAANYTKSAAVTGLAALGTAGVGTVATYALLKQGKTEAASKVFSMSKKTHLIHLFSQHK